MSTLSVGQVFDAVAPIDTSSNDSLDTASQAAAVAILVADADTDLGDADKQADTN